MFGDNMRRFNMGRGKRRRSPSPDSWGPRQQGSQWQASFYNNMGGPAFPNSEFYGIQSSFGPNPRGNGLFPYSSSDIGRESMVPDYFQRYRRNPGPRDLLRDPIQPPSYNRALRNPDREVGNMNWWGQGTSVQDVAPLPDYSRMSSWGMREDPQYDLEDSPYGQDRPRYGRDNSRYDRDQARYDRRPRRRERRRRRLPRHVLVDFCDFIRSMEPPKGSNAIQIVENGITSSKLDVKTEFYCEELDWNTEKVLFTGTLSLSGVFLSRAEAGNKKTVKHEVYKKALNVLMEKSVDEIIRMRDRGPVGNSVDEAGKKNSQPREKKLKSDKYEPEVELDIKTLTEGFKKIVTHLKANKKMYNEMSSISLIEQCMTTSHCGLSHWYQATDAESTENELPFHGTFHISTKVIARGMGYNKKKAKEDTYEKAFKNLLTKTIEEIIEGLPEHEDVEIEEDWRVRIKMANIVPANTEIAGLRKKLDETIYAVQNSTPSKNIIKSLDFIAVFQGFSPLCIYTYDENLEKKQVILCEVYFDDIFIASGEGDSKEESEKNAYFTAWQVLCTVTSGTISKFHKHLSEEECTHPNVIEILEKGSARNAASNILQLKQMNADVTEEWKMPSALVIVEQPSWEQNRRNNSFLILKYSATENGMLCQWNVHSDPDGDGFKCTVFLQDEIIGTASAKAKTTARNLAFADALFRFYESNDVIRILKRDQAASWLPWTKMVEKAEEMKKEEMGELSKPVSGGIIDAKDSTENKVQIEDKDPLTGDIKSAESDTDVLQSGTPKQDLDVTDEDIGDMDSSEEPPANKWIIRAAEEIIKTFFDTNQDPLEELAIGPGMNNAELKGMESIAHSLDLRFVTRQHEGKTFIAIHRYVLPKDIVANLKENNGTSKRYTLVSPDSLPKHADIETELERYSQLQTQNIDSDFDDSNESGDDDDDEDIDLLLGKSSAKPGQNGSKESEDEEEDKSDMEDEDGV